MLKERLRTETQKSRRGVRASRSRSRFNGARPHWLVRVMLLLIILLQLGAHRTENFVVVTLDDRQLLAKELAEAAEAYRKQLAVQWLGGELPAWHRPCVIVARIHPDLPPQGRISFEFQGGTAVDWEMKVQGSKQMVLDGVLPHEVAPTVFATYSGKPLPRWIEEGACMAAERGESRREIEELCRRLIMDDRVLSIDTLVATREYPDNALPMFAQAHSITQFLLQRGGGKRELVRYLNRATAAQDWWALLLDHYGYKSSSEFQHAWRRWAAGDGS